MTNIITVKNVQLRLSTIPEENVPQYKPPVTRIRTGAGIYVTSNREIK